MPYNKYILLHVLFIAGFIGCNELPDPPVTHVGPKWMVYQSNPSGEIVAHSLLHNSIRAIVIGPGNSKYFATDQGVSILMDSTWKTIQSQLLYYLPGDPWRHYQVNALAFGADRRLWYGLAGGGIRRSDEFGADKTFDSARVPDLTSNMIYHFASGFDGSIWVGTARGVCRYVPDASSPTGGHWVQYAGSRSPIPSEPIHALAMNPVDNTIWIGTYTNGIVINDGDLDWSYITPVENAFPILDIAFDLPSSVWFGTAGDKAYRYDLQTSEWKHIGIDTSTDGKIPLGFNVQAVAVRGPKSVIMGTEQGLLQYTNGAIAIIDTSNSPLPSNNIRALAVDILGNIWIGTDNGAAVFNPNGIR
jgi:ligand-binding sensor domain-containing protein